MELKFIIEAILFSAPKAMNAAELREVLVTAAERTEEPAAKAFKKTKTDQIEEALEQLRQDHAQLARSYRVACVAGSWQFVSEPEYAPWLRVVAGEKPRPPRLSQPALETLAIIAYRQPLTRAEMEQIRGVSVDGVIQTLLERGLIAAVGRAEVIGRPTTYGTTPQFLDYFGLRDLDELPAADELRRLEVKKPEGLLTVEAGLATAPPDALAGIESAATAPETSAAATAAPTAAATAPTEASPVESTAENVPGPAPAPAPDVAPDQSPSPAGSTPSLAPTPPPPEPPLP
jgi:segregation and condensation protein B